MLSGIKTRNLSKGAGMSSVPFLPLWSTSRTLYGPHKTTASFPLCQYSGTSTKHRFLASGTRACQSICWTTCS